MKSISASHHLARLVVEGDVREPLDPAEACAVFANADRCNGVAWSPINNVGELAPVEVDALRVHLHFLFDREAPEATTVPDGRAHDGGRIEHVGVLPIPALEQPRINIGNHRASVSPPRAAQSLAAPKRRSRRAVVAESTPPAIGDARASRPTKWGRCPRCEYALRLVILEGGPNSGQARLGCPRYKACGSRLEFVPRRLWDLLPARVVKRRHVT